MKKKQAKFYCDCGSEEVYQFLLIDEEAQDNSIIIECSQCERSLLIEFEDNDIKAKEVFDLITKQVPYH